MVTTTGTKSTKKLKVKQKTSTRVQKKPVTEDNFLIDDVFDCTEEFDNADTERNESPMQVAPKVKPVSKIGSWIIAVILIVVLGVWMFSGIVNREPQLLAEKDRLEKARALPEVQIRRFAEQGYNRSISLSGETVASRTVLIRAEKSAVVRKVHVSKGDVVKKGQLLVTLDSGDTVARIEQAKASVAREELHYDSVKKLVLKNLSSQLALADAKNLLETAKYHLKSAQNQYVKGRNRAPFAGHIINQSAEVGDFASPGSALFELADVTPVQVRVYVTEKELAAISNQVKNAELRLSTGQKYLGLVSYIAAAADASSKTFAVDIDVQTEGQQVPLGVSVDVTVVLQPVDAIRISPSLLFLDDEGKLGLKYVDGGGRVRQVDVRIIQSGSDATWVTGNGLSEKDVIVTGQGFVFAGDQVVAHSAIQDGGLNRE